MSITTTSYNTKETTYPYVSKFLVNSGNEIANGNYSGGATIFSVTPSSSKILRISRMLVQIVDGGAVSAGNYGAIASGLTNGVIVRSIQKGVTNTFTNSLPVTTNSEWARFCYDVSFTTFAGDNYTSVRWTFEKSGTILELRENDTFEVVLEDDLTGLISHTFLVQGYEF